MNFRAESQESSYPRQARRPGSDEAGDTVNVAPTTASFGSNDRDDKIDSAHDLLGRVDG